jgi:putative addiction module killer protein
VPQILRTDVFNDWLRGLRDLKARARIDMRIKRLADGNPGDVRPVGQGVSELRLNFGPGYRVYYAAHGDELILLLAGGDKSTQESDIDEALALWRDWKAENS